MTVGTVTQSAMASTAGRTFSHNNNGSYLVVAIGIADPHTVITGVTYNGVAMTRLKGQNSTSYGTCIWGLANPAAGSNNVVISCSADTFGATAVSLVTASVAVAVAGGAASGSAGASVSITTTVNNSIVVGCVFKDVAINNGVVSGSTEQTTDFFAGVFRLDCFTAAVASAGATTVGYANTGSNGEYSIAAVEIIPAAAGSLLPMFL